MPLPKTKEFKVAYSKEVKLPNNKTTLGLYNSQHHLIDLRACKKVIDKDTKQHHFTCPRNPAQRNKIVKELELNKYNKLLTKK